MQRPWIPWLAATDSDTDHKEASVADLDADTLYYYSVGGASTAPQGQTFRTAPATGSLPADGNTRIWLVGDSGTGGDDEREDYEGEAAEVRDGMLRFVENTGGGLSTCSSCWVITLMKSVVI